MDKEVIGKYEACSLSGGPDSNRSDEALGVLFFFGKIACKRDGSQLLAQMIVVAEIQSTVT